MNREICIMIILAGLLLVLIIALLYVRKKNQRLIERIHRQADLQLDQELERRLSNPLCKQTHDGKTRSDIIPKNKKDIL